MPNVDINGTTVNFPDSLNGDDLNKAVSQAASQMRQPQQSQYGTKDYIGDIARPVLEGGGAVAGGLLGAAAGPIGSAAGGALGFGAGKSAADLLDRGLGRKPLLKNPQQALVETGQNAVAGAQNEATGQVMGATTKPILKTIGNAGKTVGEWATGIPSRDFQSVANNPGSILPGTMEKAGNQFEQAMNDAGISSDLTPEAVDRIRKPGQFAFDTFEKLQKEGSINPQDALHARQSLDAIYPIQNKKNGSYIRLLDQMRDAFQGVIANTSPEIKQASTDYAIAKSGSKFQNILPQTNSGKPSYFRSAAILGGLASGHPTALFASPVVAGTTAAAAGIAGRALNNPASNRVIATALQPGINSQIPKAPDSPEPQTQQPLTKDKAREFLDQANGDRALARQLAQKAGYTW